MASPAPSRTIAATPHIICEFRSMIPQTNPKATYLEQKLAIDAAIQRVLDSGWYVGGEEVAAFEAEFAAWSGSRHAVAVASGTDALIVALRRSEEHTSELQSLMRIAYAVFCFHKN